MKIGILTFHRANNIGAVLQAYALQEYINQNIAKCELIDFIPNNNVSSKSGSVRKLLSIGRKILHPIISFGAKIRNKRFQEFREHFFNLSEKQYLGDKAMESCTSIYDVLVSGSDQILNTMLSGISKSYYLNFDNVTPKISYASSFGRTDISAQEKELIRSELIKYKALSVRESSAAQVINNEIGVRPVCVVDPVFLLNSDHWKVVSREYIIHGEYIFVYAMEYSTALAEVIKLAIMQYHIPVYIVCGNKSAEKLKGKKLYDVGPQEFLSLISGASYVITNSFHGTAFSLIFKKKFWCVAHSTRNTRLENIMDLTGNSEKLVSGKISKLEDNIVLGYESYSKANNLVEESKKYLQTWLM